MNEPLKILFKLPSRGRPEKFFKALDSIVNNLSDRENYYISATLDKDDLLMNETEVKSKLLLYKNLSIEWGLSKSKIHAINRDMPNLDWDIVVICSDDIYFNLYGFDEHIRSEMVIHFPNGDGYLHFREKDSGSALCVMPVCDKKYYNRFGYIYHEEYLSLWADNEQMEVAKMLGRYIYIPYSIMEHRNPAYLEYGEIPDLLFLEQQKIGWSVDVETYNRRKIKNFDLDLLSLK